MKLEYKTTEGTPSLFWKRRVTKIAIIEGIETNIHSSITYGLRHDTGDNTSLYKQIKQVLNPVFKKVLVNQIKAIKNGNNWSTIDTCMHVKVKDLINYSPEFKVMDAETEEGRQVYKEISDNWMYDHFSMSGSSTEGRDILAEAKERFFGDKFFSQLCKFTHRQTGEFLPNILVLVWPRGYTVYSFK